MRPRTVPNCQKHCSCLLIYYGRIYVPAWVCWFSMPVTLTSHACAMCMHAFQQAVTFDTKVKMAGWFDSVCTWKYTERQKHFETDTKIDESRIWKKKREGEKAFLRLKSRFILPIFTFCRNKSEVWQSSTSTPLCLPAAPHSLDTTLW